MIIFAAYAPRFFAGRQQDNGYAGHASSCCCFIFHIAGQPFSYWLHIDIADDVLC